MADFHHLRSGLPQPPARSLRLGERCCLICLMYSACYTAPALRGYELENSPEASMVEGWAVPTRNRWFLSSMQNLMKKVKIRWY